MMRFRTKAGIVCLIVAIAVSVLAWASQRSATDHRIEIWKAKRELSLYSGDHLVRTYRIALGSQSIGRKERQGDRKTPEGQYNVCIKNPQSRYYLSLGLSYPNAADAKRGIDAGLIDDEVFRTISKAEERRVCPPWDTALGGEIYIHGNGSSEDWTWGCPALDDKDMLELYEAVSLGTRVDIHP